MVNLPSTLINVDDETAEHAYSDVLELVRSKLAVVKPGYDAHDAQAEQDIVA